MRDAQLLGLVCVEGLLKDLNIPFGDDKMVNTYVRGRELNGANRVIDLMIQTEPREVG